MPQTQQQEDQIGLRLGDVPVPEKAYYCILVALSWGAKRLIFCSYTIAPEFSLAVSLVLDMIRGPDAEFWNTRGR
jgi:hypothetical protein